MTADRVIDDYVAAVIGAGVLRHWNDLVPWVNDHAEAIESGSSAIMDLVIGQAMSFAEGWAWLDSAKAIGARQLMARRSLGEGGHDPAIVIARSDAEEMAAYLRERPHPTAVVSLHLLGDEYLVVFVVANFRVPGQRGREGSWLSCLRIGRIRDAFLPAVNHYAAAVNDGRPDFDAVAEPLAFLGAVLLSLLGGRVPTELVFIPHRMLHVLPLHTIPLNDEATVRIVDVVRTIRYCSSAADLTYGSVSIGRQDAGNPRILSVLDAASGLRSVGIEQDIMAAVRHQVGGSATVEVVTNAAALPSTFDDHVWVNWNSHARSSTDSWGGSHLVLGDRLISAAHVAEHWRFPRRPAVVLAACQTALDTTLTATVDEYCGMDMAFRIAGASSVVASTWAASDPVAALTAMLVLGECMRFSKPPAQALTSLQRAMRHGLWQDALLRPDQLRELPQETAELIHQAQRRFLDLPADAFGDPSAWSVFRCHG